MVIMTTNESSSAEVPKGHAYTSRDEAALGRVRILAHYYKSRSV